jgi:hypothetical protein
MTEQQELWTTATRRTLAAVLDDVLPASADGRMPAASALGLASTVERSLHDGAPSAAPILEGLATLDELAVSRGVDGFAALGAPDRLAALRALPQDGWFRMLLVQAYGGYYQNPRVVEALGLDPSPPFPRGHQVPPSDPSLLDHVRGRARMYREV